MATSSPMRNRISAYRRTLQVKLHLLRLSTKRATSSQVPVLCASRSVRQHAEILLSYFLRYTLFALCDPVRSSTSASGVETRELSGNTGRSERHEASDVPRERDVELDAISTSSSFTSAVSSASDAVAGRERREDCRGVGVRDGRTVTIASSKAAISGITRRTHHSMQERPPRQEQPQASVFASASVVKSAPKCGSASMTMSASTSVSESGSFARAGPSDKQLTPADADMLNLTSRSRSQPQPQPHPPPHPHATSDIPTRPLRGTFRADGLFLPEESSLRYSWDVPHYPMTEGQAAAPVFACTCQVLPDATALNSYTALGHNLAGIPITYACPAHHQAWPYHGDQFASSPPSYSHLHPNVAHTAGAGAAHHWHAAALAIDPFGDTAFFPEYYWATDADHTLGDTPFHDSFGHAVHPFPPRIENLSIPYNHYE